MWQCVEHVCECMHACVCPCVCSVCMHAGLESRSGGSDIGWSHGPVGLTLAGSLLTLIIKKCAVSIFCYVQFFKVRSYYCRLVRFL